MSLQCVKVSQPLQASDVLPKREGTLVDFYLQVKSLVPTNFLLQTAQIASFPGARSQHLTHLLMQRAEQRTAAEKTLQAPEKPSPDADAWVGGHTVSLCVRKSGGIGWGKSLFLASVSLRGSKFWSEGDSWKSRK